MRHFMRALIRFVALVVLSACNNGPNTKNTLDTVTHQQPLVDSTFKTDYNDLISPENSLSAWQIDFESKTKTRNPGFKEDNLNVDTLIHGLNTMFPNIQLRKIKVSRDTLYTEIQDSYYLNERMGTSGAEFYVASVVINLTSVNNVNYVKIDFEEGSHASPGIWNKADFSDYKEIR
ncbi:MAG: hypothetical protein JWP81_5141 [Ferruginibacter sp.]|nr:hypothetical protein [Ferruginibacter sp.]